MTTQKILLDSQMAQDLTLAVISTVQQMFSVEVKADPCTTGEGKCQVVGDVSGIISIVQNVPEGSLMLCTGFDTLKDLLGRVLGQGTVVTREVAADAIGEITNMVYGSLKTNLNRRGYSLRLGIPNVIIGHDHIVSQMNAGKYMLVPFHINGRLFQAHLVLRG